jgi:hypothetical protein
MTVAVSAASLCINRRLYRMTCICASVVTATKHRAVVVDLAIGVGFPSCDDFLYVSVLPCNYSHFP